MSPAPTRNGVGDALKAGISRRTRKIKMGFLQDNRVISDIYEVEAIDRERGKVSLKEESGGKIGLEMSYRVIPKLILKLFSLLSSINRDAYSKSQDRRVFSFPMIDVGVEAIDTKSGRQAILSFQLENEAVFRFAVPHRLCVKMLRQLNGHFGSGIH